MGNPFQKLFKQDTTTDNAKKDLHKAISKKAWDISKKVPFGKCKLSDILELEKLYNKYFTLYPDERQENDAKDRIKKLKTMCR